MADQIDKDTGEPIHFNEAYRRAKRNALFWAAATFALAWGYSDDGVLELTPLVRDLSFNHALVVVIALSILGFMALGFYRATRDIERRNSNFQEDAFDTSASAEEIVQKTVRDHFAELAKQMEKMRLARINAERVDERIGSLVASLPLAVPDVDGQVDTIFEGALVGHRTRDALPMNEFAMARERARELLVRWAEECRARIRKSKDEARDYGADLGRASEGLASEMITAVHANLEALAIELGEAKHEWAKLQNFSDHLDQTKLNWHRWYDTFVSWVVIGLGTSAAAWFLLGTMLPTLLTPGEWLLQLAT